MAPELIEIISFPKSDTAKRAKVFEFLTATTDLKREIGEKPFDRQQFQRFLQLAESASKILEISSEDLSERAGRARNYIAALSRKRQQVQRHIMLKVLDALIGAAKDRLFDESSIQIGLPPPGSPPGAEPVTDPNVSEAEATERLIQIGVLCLSLAELARQEINQISARRPNDLDAAEQDRRTVELLLLFASSFEQIGQVLGEDLVSRSPLAQRNKASRLATKFSQQLMRWFDKEGDNVLKSTAQLSLMAGGVAIMNYCGADMKIATGLVGAAVLGGKASELAKKTIKRLKTK